MVLDGHDGETAADFACQHLASSLLHGIRQDCGMDEVKRALQKAFIDTETQFFVKIDDAVIRKQTLMEEMSVSDTWVWFEGVACSLYSKERPPRTKHSSCSLTKWLR